MFWYDYYYLILVVPALVISLIAQINVKKAYSSMARIPNAKRITGAEAARRVLAHYNINNVQVEMTHGKLTDHYDPRSNVIRLSPEVFQGTSIASVGIAFVMLVGNKLIIAGRLTTGSFASFITSLLLLYKPVKTLGQDLTNMQSIFVALSRVFQLFDFTSRIEDKGDKKLTCSPSLIQFKNVSFSYDNEKQVLQNTVRLNVFLEFLVFHQYHLLMLLNYI